jgi:acylphosphatase
MPAVRPSTSSASKGKAPVTLASLEAVGHSGNEDKKLLVQVEFEVFGEIGGTFFLKYAKLMCEKLGIKGWVRLSRRGTVFGQIQGEKERVDEMALWLRLQGSPGSKIEHTEFKNWQIIEHLDFRTFSVRF